MRGKKSGPVGPRARVVAEAQPATAVAVWAGGARPLLGVAERCVREAEAAIGLWRVVEPMMHRVLEAVGAEGVPEGRDGRELLREVANCADRAARCAAMFTRATTDLVRLQGYMEGGFRVVGVEAMTEAELEREVVVVARALQGAGKRCVLCGVVRAESQDGVG